MSSNTSGIPIHFLIQDRSDDFKKHFCGTHFFNPPRYLKLLEIIPTSETKSDVVEFLWISESIFSANKRFYVKILPHLSQIE